MLFLKKNGFFTTELMSAIYQIIVYDSTSTQIIGTIYTISQIPHCLYSINNKLFKLQLNFLSQFKQIWHDIRL